MGGLYSRLMRTIFITFTLILIVSACAVSQPSLTPTPILTVIVEPVSGEWLGGFAQPDGKVISLLVNFSENGKSLNIQPFKKSQGLTNFVQIGEKIAFDVEGKSLVPYKNIHFEGNFSVSGFVGSLNWDGDSYQVEFIPLTQIAPEALDKYVGVYRFDSGRMVSVLLCPSYDDGTLQYFPPGLMFTDLNTGDSRGLYPLEVSSFGIGSARVLAYPLEKEQIKFDLNDAGEVISLQSFNSDNSANWETASRINYSVEDVKFTSEDGAVMAGLLTSPVTPGLHPAFMMLHGSEPGVKDGFGQQILAHYMISQGIALLTYDKRGVGGSDGVYRESPDDANIKLIASDAVAGAKFLSSRPEVDSAKIGLIGGSQAGWVIPVAAAQSVEVDFFVIQSGPVTSTAQEDLYSAVTNDGDSVTTYDADKLNQTIRGMNPASGNPLPILADITQPGFWMWGSVDKNIPATVSAENLQALIDLGKGNFSYVMLQNGDHNLNESPHGYFAEIPYSPRVLYFSELTRWFKEKGIVSNE